MKSVIILIFGINPVSRESAAQSVGTVVHYRDGLYYIFAVHALAGLVYYSGYGAAARYSYLSFF
jgi:hypothetical protein